ncbi:hypothetical protein DP113_20925 [Brasilonema octagenarum UFV-E1]|uniref:Uncharacterized protein n=2 Tax=Brasilonema TaxID=383614 RepID=A0A856MLH0_9CYAN|nr:hypothetical protein [Brasilonema octagenarum UFV-OR1]QDL10037.1 hypothetical protein DP114_21000 [Brasilonema sennae CENA114]QDL16390.1 hypothetical protein DP113_20925 [Brasilonema octagenarum UFV-E1]
MIRCKTADKSSCVRGEVGQFLKASRMDTSNDQQRGVGVWGCKGVGEPLPFGFAVAYGGRPSCSAVSPWAGFPTARHVAWGREGFPCGTPLPRSKTG